MGRRDYRKLFKHYNRKNHEEGLEWEDWRAAIRKDGRLGTARASERVLRTLFYMVDLDNDGFISEEEFVIFLGVQEELGHKIASVLEPGGYPASAVIPIATC